MLCPFRKQWVLPFCHGLLRLIVRYTLLHVLVTLAAYQHCSGANAHGHNVLEETLHHEQPNDAGQAMCKDRPSSICSYRNNLPVVYQTICAISTGHFLGSMTLNELALDNAH